VAEEEKRRKAEEAKAAAAAAAEARRAAAEEKRRKDDEAKAAAIAAVQQAAEAKRKEAEEKRAAAIRARKAQESVKQAKPRSTFSLTALFGSSKDSSDAASARPTVEPQMASSAPRGVPTISGWTQNRDGSITGRISGRSGFKDGEKIETSPIGGKAIGGTIVTTASGSK
jgi:membrane protein involved in colicin uptake